MSARRDGEGKEREACPNSYDSKRMNFLTLDESSPSCNYLVEGRVYVRSNRVFFFEGNELIQPKTEQKRGRRGAAKKLSEGSCASKTIPAQLIVPPLALSMYSAVPTDLSRWYGPRRRRA